MPLPLSGLAFYLGVQNVSLRGKRPLTRSTVLQDVHSAVLVLDNEGTILDANPAAMEMLNLTVQGGLYHHSSLSRGVVSDLSLSSHHNTVKSHDWDNGEQRTFDITVRPVAETTGVHSAAVVTIHETTEWLRLKQANQDIHLRYDRAGTAGDDRHALRKHRP